MLMRYGFLGPETTFTHQALLQALAQTPRTRTGEDAPELRPFPSVAAATTALVEGEIGAIMAPIENSVEGGVSGTLDVPLPAIPITVYEIDTVLVRGNCIDYPSDPGCF